MGSNPVTWSKTGVTSEPQYLPWSRSIYSFSHHLSILGLWPSSSLSTGCAVSLRGHWAIFCHAGSGRVGGVRSAREKSLEVLPHGWELNPGHREDRQWAIPLSYHDWNRSIAGVFSLISIWNHPIMAIDFTILMQYYNNKGPNPLDYQGLVNAYKKLSSHCP